MIVRALSLTVGQLGDRRIIAVFAKSMLITLLLCAALGLALARGAQLLFNRWVDASLLDGTSHGVAGGVIGALTLLLVLVLGFRLVAIPVLSFFGDEVVAAVEARHYPERAGAARRVGFGVAARLGLLSAGRFLLVNLLALPIYLFLLITAVGPLILFMAINAVLLGRDLAEMVAVRHLDSGDRRQWLRNHRFDFLLLGLIVTGLFLIPFVNLAAPVIGAGAAAHLFHRSGV